MMSIVIHSRKVYRPIALDTYYLGNSLANRDNCYVQPRNFELKTRTAPKAIRNAQENSRP
jgi:hypothetical protein